MKLSKMQTW